MSALPRLRVSPAELRERFHRGRYLERASAGEFTPVLKDEFNPTSPDEPPGTRRQTVVYVTQAGQPVFIVHRYLRPDGTIGGRGQPDPKWLLEGDVIYYC